MKEISKEGTGERGRFIWDEENHKYVRELPKKTVEVNAPYVIRDEIVGGIESWVDGKIYDSKSRLRKSYKENGVIEKGNDRIPWRRHQTDEERYKDIREDVTKAYYDIKYDRVPLTELEKEKCLREQRQMELAKQRDKTRWAK